MIGPKKFPTYILRWSVQKVNQNLYAVSATIDGHEYEFVGNFKSISDANKAGRRYASDLLYNTKSRWSLSLRSWFRRSGRLLVGIRFQRAVARPKAAIYEYGFSCVCSVSHKILHKHNSHSHEYFTEDQHLHSLATANSNKCIISAFLRTSRDLSRNSYQVKRLKRQPLFFHTLQQPPTQPMTTVRN